MISVVIPTCRRPDLLARCLDRLAPGAQTLGADRYEVIVTDDGEPTVQAVLREKYPWAQWVQGPRKGPAANRNNGARQARLEWIAFTDDDCVPSPEWLNAYAAATRSGREVYEGKTTCAAGLKSPMECAPVNLTGGCMWSCNMMISATAFHSVGGFDEGFPYPHLEDSDLRERLTTLGRTLEFVPDALIDHPPRRRPNGIQMGRYHESWLYWWYKGGHHKFGSPRLLWLLFRVRMKTLIGCSLGSDTVRAAAATVAEFGTLAVRLPGWEWKYRRRFRRDALGSASPIPPSRHAMKSEPPDQIER